VARSGRRKQTSLTTTAFALVAALIASPAVAKDEKFYQRMYCAGMELEHRLNDGARIDCLTAEYANRGNWRPSHPHQMGRFSL
jgi:hypothetical protein